MSDEAKTTKRIRGKYCEEQRIAQVQYTKKTFFNTQLRREDKPLIKAAAEKSGMSMYAFVQSSVMDRVREILTEEEIAAINSQKEE